MKVVYTGIIYQYHVKRAAWDISWEGTQFKSLLVYRLSWLKFLMILLSLSGRKVRFRQIKTHLSKSAHTSRSPYHFIRRYFFSALQGHKSDTVPFDLRTKYVTYASGTALLMCNSIRWNIPNLVPKNCPPCCFFQMTGWQWTVSSSSLYWTNIKKSK